MNQRGAIPSCTQLLHAPARPRGLTIGDLCRLAAAQDLGRHCGRGFLCYSVDLYPLDAQLHLRGVWQPALVRRDLLRFKAGRSGNRRGGGHSYREPSIEKQGDVGAELDIEHFVRYGLRGGRPARPQKRILLPDR
jgi:hypothetical protein